MLSCNFQARCVRKYTNQFALILKKVWDYFNYINNNLQLNESHTLIRIDDLGMVKRVLSLIQYGILSYLLELVLNKSGSCEWML